MAVSTIDALYNGTSEKLTTSATGITVTGNVGIGTTNGDVRNDGNAARTYVSIIGAANRGVLNIGSTASAGADGGKITFVNGTNAIGEIYVDPNSGSQTNGFMVFSTSNSERMRIDSSGRVMIGATSTTRNLTVSSSGQTDLAIIAASGSSAQLCFGDGDDDNVGQIEYSHPTDSMRFYTQGTERMRVLSSGGLTFNGDTATANALNDYEEGTWTPTATNGGSFSNSAYGTYTKIGNVVTLHATLIVSSNSSGLGFGITSLPFAQSSSNTEAAAGFYMRYTTDSTYRMFYLSNGSVISVYNLGGGATTFSTASTKRYDFSGVYYTDS